MLTRVEQEEEYNRLTLREGKMKYFLQTASEAEQNKWKNEVFDLQAEIDRFLWTYPTFFDRRLADVDIGVDKVADSMLG